MKTIPGKQQFVSFPIYKLDPAWRRLPEPERRKGKAEFCEVMESWQDRMILLAYSLVGMRGDSDFFLWRVSYNLEDLEAMSAELMNTGLGKYLNVPYSYLSMTRRSIYVEEHQKVDPDGHGSRLEVVPGQTALSHASKAFDADGKLTDARAEKSVRALMAALVATATRFRAN